MADAESRIDINIDASQALATIKNLQRQISAFHQELQSSGSAANAAMSQNMQRNLINSINATKQFSASLTNVRSTTESFTDALEKNKLSMNQYFKYGMASTKTFGKMFKGEFETLDKVARERVKTLQTQYIKLGRDANGALEAIKIRPLTLDMNNLGTQMQMNIQKQQVFNQLLKQGSTNLLNFGKNTQWAGRQLMVGFTIPLSIMGASAIKSFMEMEEAVIKFKRVYGELNTTISETDNMAKSIEDLAKSFTKYGIAVKDTMELAAEAAAMGKMGVELTAQVTEATRLAVLGGVEQSQALETTISVTNAFGVATEDLANKIDFLNAVENQTVTSIEDLTTAIPKAGPVVQQLGGNVEDLAFFLTAMKEGGINASEGANALKSGLASLINPTKQSSEMLAGFGINVKGLVEANAGDLKGTVISFATALDALDPLNRARAIEQLFGKFQFSRISTLFQNVVAEGTQAQRVLELSKATQEELAILSDRELKRVEDSPAYKFQKSIEDVKASLVPLGQEFIKLITPIIEFGNKILKAFNNMDDGVKQFVVGAIGVLGLIAPVALMTFGLFANGIANLIKGFGFVRNVMLNLSGASSGVSMNLQYLTNEQLEASAVAASLGQSHANLAQIFTSEASALYGLIGAYQSATAAQSSYNVASAVRPSRPTGLVDPRGNPLKLANGIFSVPGPKGAGDIVPAMLTPGEAVIPADRAKKYGPLISGIIADNIPGFQGGYQETHVAMPMQKTPAVLAELDKIFPRISTFSDRLLEATVVLSDLTATKSTTLNQKAKNSGMSSAEFSSEWNKTSGEGFKNVASRAQAAGQMGSGAEIDQAIEQLDIEIGARVADRIDNGNIDKSVKSWLDQLMADVTQTVINEFAVSGNEAKQQVAAGMKARASMPVTARQVGVQNIKKSNGEVAGSAEAFYEDLIASGEAELRETAGRPQVFATGTDIAVGRTKSSGKLRTNSFTIGAGKNVVPGGTFETGARSLDKLKGPAVQPVLDATDDADAYVGEFAKQVEAKSQDPYMYTRDRNSPNPFASPDGTDDANAYKASFESGMSSSGPLAPPPPPGFEVPQTFEPPVEAKKGIKAGIGTMFKEMATGVKEQGKKKGLELGEKALMPFAKLLAKGSGNVLVSEYQKENVEYDSETGITTNAATGAVVASAAMSNNSEPLPLAYDKDGNVVTNPDGTPMTADAYKKLEKQSKAQKRVSRAGKVAGAAGFVAMGAGMVGGMIGGEVGNIMTTMVAPIAGAVAMIAPILLSLSAPVAIVVGALGLIAFGLFKYNEELQKVRKEARELAESLGSGAKAMGRFAEFAGTVTPTEIMQQRRSGMGNQIVEVLGKTEFGKNFVGSEQGQDLIKSVEAGMSQIGREQTVNSVARQLISAVATNVLTVDQAEQIALHLGDQLDDFSIATNIVGQMNEFFGPNGENLANGDALEIFVKLSTQSVEGFQSNILEAFKGLSGQGGWYQALGLDNEQKISFTAGAIGSFFEEQQNAIDGFLVSQDKVIDNTLKEAKALQAKGDAEAANAKFAEVDKLRAERASGLVTIQNEYSDAIKQSLALLEGADANSKYAGMTREQVIEELVKKQAADGLPEDRVGAAIEADQIMEQIVKIDNFASRTLDSLGQGVIDKFSEADDVVKAMINGAVNGIKNIDGLDVASKIVLTSAVGSGALTPAQVGSMLDIFKDDDDMDKYLNIVADVGIKFGQGGMQQIGGIIELIGSRIEDEVEKKGATVNLLDFVSDKSKNQEDFNMIMDMLSTMSSYMDLMGGPDALLNFIGLDDASMKTLTGRLKKMQGLIDKSTEPITVQTLIEQKIITDQSAINAFIGNQEYFDKLDPVQQYLYVQTFLSVIGTITDDQVIAELEASGVAKTGARRVGGISGGEFTGGSYTASQIAAKRAELANKISESVTNVSSAFGDLGDDSGSNTEGGGGTDPFQDILKRLQNIRDAAIDATGGLKELLRVAGKGKNIKIFGGIAQQLTKSGFNEEFVNYITSLDKETQKLFITISNGKVALTSTGAAMKSAFDEAILGDFQQTQVKTVADIYNQQKALVKLTGSGIGLSEAYKIVADTALAAAIATGKISTAEWDEITKSIKEATEATKQFNSAQAIAGSNTEFGQKQDILKWVQDNKDILTPDMVSEILGNVDLQNLIFAGGDLTQEQRDTLGEYFQNIIDGVDLELDIKKLTIEGMEDIFNDGFNKAMEAFAAEEKAIQIKFEIDTAADQDIVKSAEEDIALINFKIDDLDAGLTEISDQEDEINSKYDERIKALDQVKKLNDDASKEQKSQLTIADALTRGDISAAAAAVQDLRAQKAAASLTTQQDLLEKSREQALAALVASNGKTRKQIEDEIKSLKNDIFVIEEKTLEPAQERIRLAGIERDNLIDQITIMGKTKLEWDKIKNGIDLAKTRSDIYKDSMQQALDIVKNIEDYWKGLNRTVTTVHEIIERITGGTPPPTAPDNSADTAPGNGDGTGTGPGTTVPPKKLNPDYTKWMAADKQVKEIQKQLDSSQATLNKFVKERNSLEALGSTVRALTYQEPRYQELKNKLVPQWLDTVRWTGKALTESTAARNTISATKPSQYLAKGGMVKPSYFKIGGFAKGTDTVPAMLTPGEFVVKKYAVDSFGIDNLKAINNGTFSGGSVYNSYEVNLNVKSDANPDQIARVVMTQIKQIDSQRIRGNRI